LEEELVTFHPCLDSETFYVGKYELCFAMIQHQHRVRSKYVCECVYKEFLQYIVSVPNTSRS